ncbi:MAG: hypothetical protein H6545_09380 [Bacteroidales bacterium]|nr:hypothetical protein [Bacteroidales bacterium]
MTLLPETTATERFCAGAQQDRTVEGETARLEIKLLKLTVQRFRPEALPW